MTIREKADCLLAQTGLMDVLCPHKAVIVGSYAMDLMTWNDLDIYVDIGEMSVEKWFETVSGAVKAVQPTRIDGFQDAEKGKFFLGMETMITGERWNIDIWGKTSGEIANALAENRAMKARFEADVQAREAMMRIKNALIGRKMYGFDKGREHFHSPEIYEAVLERGIRTPEAFLGK